MSYVQYQGNILRPNENKIIKIANFSIKSTKLEVILLFYW